MRLPDWPERLADTIARLEDEPFRWGRHDCGTFAAECVEAITGADPIAGFRGAYEDEAGAKQALKEIGAGSLYHTLTKLFGKSVPPARARRGDLVLIRTELGPTLFVCLGEHCVGPGYERAESRRTLDGRHAWRVG
ncbi:MAG: DUF6950 family protein [Alphaproteobacteria bacterium]